MRGPGQRAAWIWTLGLLLTAIPPAGEARPSGATGWARKTLDDLEVRLAGRPELDEIAPITAGASPGSTSKVAGAYSRTPTTTRLGCSGDR